MNVDICGDSGISLVASLPDDWIGQTIARFEQDNRFTHIPVNREGLARPMFWGFSQRNGAMALMGAPGL